MLNNNSLLQCFMICIKPNVKLAYKNIRNKNSILYLTRNNLNTNSIYFVFNVCVILERHLPTHLSIHIFTENGFSENIPEHIGSEEILLIGAGDFYVSLMYT